MFQLLVLELKTVISYTSRNIFINNQSTMLIERVINMSDIDDFIIASSITYEQLNLLSKELSKIFSEMIDRINKDIAAYYYKMEKKVKYKRVIKIYPDKTYIEDKRIANYYCRNNL